MEAILFGYEKKQDVIKHFTDEWEVEKSEIEKYRILFALVDYPDYEGLAYYVLQEKATGKLFDVSGSHCSCHGFEGQFEPQETDIRAIEKYEFYRLEDHNNEEVKLRIKEIRGLIKS